MANFILLTILLGSLLSFATCSADGQVDTPLQDEAQAVGPYPFIIVKSPRVGSTSLFHILDTIEHVEIAFEPKPSTYQTWWQSLHCQPSICANKHKDTCSPSDYSCGLSMNNFVKRKTKFEDIVRLLDVQNPIPGQRPRLIIQLRWNVVEKAISASRVFGDGKRQREKLYKTKCTVGDKKVKKQCAKDQQKTMPVDVKSVAEHAVSSLETINATIEAAMWLEQTYNIQPLYVFYEDLARDSHGIQNEIEKFIGLPISRFPANADGNQEDSYFHNKDLSKDLVNFKELQEELLKKHDPNLISMLSAGFNKHVNTRVRLDELKQQLKPQLRFGYW